MVFYFTQFWLDGRPGNEYFLISNKISDLLTPLAPLGVRPQWFETDLSHSSYSARGIVTQSFQFFKDQFVCFPEKNRISSNFKVCNLKKVGFHKVNQKNQVLTYPEKL